MLRLENEMIMGWSKKNMLVSIFCVSYNHEKYIRDVLEGFLLQKTNFPIEILIHDDASTDKTADIIKEYEIKYPYIIKPIYQDENQLSQGIRPNIKYNIPRASGKYIAFCDGDDYWIDPFKLQKQVDFMEKNLKFVACAHNAKIMDETNEDSKSFVNFDMSKNIFTVDDFTKGEAYFHASSMLFRNSVELTKAYKFLDKHKGDWFRLIVFSQYGPIKYIDDVMSVYRIHDKGVWSLMDKKQQVLRNLKSTLDFNKIFNYKYEENFLNLFVRVSVNEFQNLAIDNIKSLFIDLEKDMVLKIIIKLYESLAEKDKILLEKENYIDEKHKIITWYEGVVQTLNNKK